MSNAFKNGTNVYSHFCSKQEARKYKYQPLLCFLGNQLTNYLQNACSALILHSKYPSVDINCEDVMNALYNIHASEHIKQCFTKSGECRYKFPKAISSKTEIVVIQPEVPIYDINGQMLKKQFVNTVLQQKAYDIYTNSYCPIISKSKIACNSNVSFISNEKVSLYVNKYVSKDTKKDDKYN